MIAMQTARIITRFLLFLELTDDETLDPDVAVEMMEWVGSRLDALDKAFLRELVDAFAVIATEYDGEAQKLVRDIPYNFYLEEELAADDPVKLAELDALREVRGARKHRSFATGGSLKGSRERRFPMMRAGGFAGGHGAALCPVKRHAHRSPQNPSISVEGCRSWRQA